MQINIAGSGHTAPLVNGAAQWLPYTPALENQRQVIVKAIHILTINVKGSRPCNAAFQALPNGRSFDDVLNDDSIWISYNPDNADYGFTNRVGGSDITVCELAFRWGLWTVVGTLVHEMAHTNGADATTHAAEGTLLNCGLSRVHDPSIVGTRDTDPVYVG